MRRLKSVVYFFLLLLCIGRVLAQADDCPVLVQSAIQAVGNLCASTGLNQACYGNLSLKADPQPGVTGFAFDKPGDVVRVANLKALHVDPFDDVKKEWGVALMRLQANIPDTLPGQSVSFLVFGNVQLENKVEPVVSPLITLASSTVLLGEPQADAALVGALSAGDKAFALSQSTDGQWVRVELDGSDSRTGWIPSALIPQAGELPTFDINSLNPMQAFSLQTGVTGVKCASAPQDGVLVQTPGGGDLKIKLTVNDVNIELGSTAFIQAQPSNIMRFSVIEGKGSVESNGQTVDVPAGSWVSVPMDENLEPIGTISQPKGYQPGDVDNLPVGLLGRPITVAPPIIAADTFLCVSNPNGAWIRQQPNSANQTILRVLAAGNSVIDSGSTTNDGSQVWRQVETSDEQVTGWVEDASLSNCANANVSGTTPIPITTTPAILENCTPRPDWTLTYTVQPGNTLAEIARASEVSLGDLALGNCIADVNRIIAGQKLRVPKLVIIVTALPPIEQPLVEITPSPTVTTAPPQLASGQWLITATLQYQNCPDPVQSSPVVSTSYAAVVVNADASVLSVTSGGETVTMRRTGNNVYVGQVVSLKGTATLNITVPNGANTQASIYISAPCPAQTTAPAAR
ncbi:MAG: LysM peptidoglycan-binding domain-containing protein [Anaerolineaceae bacterium]|nr:LysM peptidoglycan-binding domain-containing protein [Anaerolineaceae bacterium]